MDISEYFEYKEGAEGWGLYWTVNRASIKVKGKRFGAIMVRKRDAEGAPIKQYRVGTAIRKSRQEHRLIWELLRGPIPKGMQIDHIDGDSLNNCIDNLRLVSNRINSRNQKRRANNKSGYTGVSYFKNKAGNEYWRVGWIDNSGKAHGKVFPHTDEGKRMAIEYRRERVAELGGYTDRHGLEDRG